MKINKNELVKSINFKFEDFIKSSFCDAPSGHCVLVAQKNNLVAVRDSKDISQATLVFDKDEWKAFIEGVKVGEFDV